MVRGLALDTVNPNGGADGSLDAAQFSWLEAEIAAGDDRIFVVFSHHTVDTMDNSPLWTWRHRSRTGGSLDTAADLAALARELAANDWQSRDRPDPLVDGRRGAVKDRDVELVLKAPFALLPS